MAIMDMLRTGKIKAELEEVTKDRDSLRSTLSSVEHMDHYELTKAIVALGEQRAESLRTLSELENHIARRREESERELVKLSRDIERRRAEFADEARLRQGELVMMDDEILLQSFGFYRPRYDLANSETYKANLDNIRRQQEVMVKGGRAAFGSTTWTINNSQREGERMVKGYVKLILRSFNNECDASITGVKFNNVESIEKRIQKAFDTLNTLGGRMSISISPDYLLLKLQELYLYHEYQVKKQQEREEQKAMRERMREEAKALKEIEEIKAKLAKEESHFSRALANIETQISRAASATEKELLEAEKSTIQQRMSEIESSKQDVLRREQNTRAGYVYIISNLGSFGENIYKIGVTRRLDPQERIDELGDASVPFCFDIHALIFSDDAPALETALHKAFEHRRLNLINRRREFFHVTLDEIKQVVMTNFGKAVEYLETADADEYRQSMVLKQGAMTGASVPISPLVLTAR
jgi:hypothetical protein